MPFKVATIDRTSKPTSMSFEIKAASTNPQLQTLVDATDALIIGAAASGVKSTLETIDAGSAVPPTDKDAEATNKWLLRVQDSVNGKKFTHEIGTADSALLPSSTSDFIDLTVGAGLTFKTAFEVVYESPYGNAGVLLSVQQVTRKG